MKLTTIEGRSGTGKTDYVIKSMVEKINNGEKCYIVVPDAITYETEFRLMKELGGGLLGAEVLSLNRLAQKALANAGGITRQFLSNEGKIMVLRKIIEENKKNLILYANSSVRSGFAEIASEMIANLKTSEISPSDLLDASEQIPDNMLKNKFDDIYTIYDSFESFMSGKYIDAEDHLSLLIERMPYADMFIDSTIYFDGFASIAFNKQFISLLCALSGVCDEIQMTLRAPNVDDEDYDFFIKDVDSRSRILETFRDLVDCEVVRINLNTIQTDYSKTICEASKILEKNLFSYNNKKFKSESIAIFKATNPSEEVMQATAIIDKLIRNGTKANSIAIALGESETYSSLLRKSLRTLPIHMDEARPLDTHPIVTLTLAAINAASSRTNIDNLLAIGKSGFAPVSVEEVESLELYCNKFGLKYNSIEQDDYFFRGSVKEPKLFELAKSCRDRLLEPLYLLRSKLKNSDISLDYCKAIFEYYEDMQTRQILEDFCMEWDNRGEYDIAAENSQVWNAILELLDQIALLLEGEMTPSRFGLVLQEGFFASKIGMIPSTPDQISVGDVSRLSIHDDIKHLIILGCNEGKMPANSENAGLVDDDDIEMLEEFGMDYFNKSDYEYSCQLHEIYSLLSRAKESVYLSWSTNDSKGDIIFASRIAEKVSALFPNSEIKHATFDASNQIDSREALKYTISDIRNYLDNDTSIKSTKKTYAYLKNDINTSTLLSEAERRLFSLPLILDADASVLFSHSNTESVTKVEQFNLCPFKHFVSYGLRADERNELKVENMDLGNVYHKVIDIFTKQIIITQASWRDLTKQVIEKRIDDILFDVIRDHNEGVFLQTARNRSRVKKVRLTLNQTLYAIIEQINSGEFTPIYSEAESGINLPYIQIKLSNGEIVKLVGKIDRVDVAEYENHQMIRIIDYKSGGMDFSFDELYYGVKLQLPLYLHAASKLGIPSGMFYLHVKDVERKVDPETSNVDELQKQYRLQGLMVADEKIIKAMDSNFEKRSEIIPVKINKDGEISSSSQDFLIPLDEMNIVIDYSIEKTTSTVEQIRSGVSDVLPIKSKNIDSCKFCNYSSICRFEFNRNSRFRSSAKMNSQTFFDKIDE